MTRVHVMSTTADRLRGLLFSKPSKDTVMLVGCSDVHTFGMGYSLDLAFVDHRGVVMKSYRAVEPRCRVRCAGAAAALERASQAALPWFMPGQFAGEAVRKGLKKRRKQ